MRWKYFHASLISEFYPFERKNSDLVQIFGSISTFKKKNQNIRD